MSSTLLSEDSCCFLLEEFEEQEMLINNKLNIKYFDIVNNIDMQLPKLLFFNYTIRDSYNLIKIYYP